MDHSLSARQAKGQSPVHLYVVQRSMRQVCHSPGQLTESWAYHLKLRARSRYTQVHRLTYIFFNICILLHSLTLIFSHTYIFSYIHIHLRTTMLTDRPNSDVVHRIASVQPKTVLEFVRHFFSCFLTCKELKKTTKINVIPADRPSSPQKNEPKETQKN